VLFAFVKASVTAWQVFQTLNRVVDFFAAAAVSQRLFEPAVIGRKKWDVFLMNSQIFSLSTFFQLRSFLFQSFLHIFVCFLSSCTVKKVNFRLSNWTEGFWDTFKSNIFQKKSETWKNVMKLYFSSSYAAIVSLCYKAIYGCNCCRIATSWCHCHFHSLPL